MKFDVIVGNPPYQNGSGNKGSNNTLWDKFVIRSFELLNEGGYLCYVHPSRWRKHTEDLWPIMTSKQINYLEIHNVDDGQKTFGCTTRYDWYVMHNRAADALTKVKDEDGIVTEVDLRKIPFLPNAMIDEILSLVANVGDEKIQIIHNSAYHTANYNKNGKVEVSKEKTKHNKYPCVNSIDINEVPKFRWASFNDKGHFGIPKVIFPSGVVKSVGFLVDAKGEYGMTEWCKGIVDAPKTLPLIQKALYSEKFQKMAKAFGMASTELDRQIMQTFRKDFWKHFVDENGEELSKYTRP